MNKIKLFENELGFYIDYIFEDNHNKKCLRMACDNDYFSFSIFSPDIQMVNRQKINIDSINPLFLPIKNLLENQPYFEVLEEGTNEGKSIIFRNNGNSVDIILNLTDISTHIASISLTNVRLASPNVTFGKESPKISDFKNKLNSTLLDIKNIIYEQSM